jgi:Spx/MgsR family transcriptional regulator
MIKIYGIPNCDTMKKARRWLDERGIEYRFHNYKKDGLEEQLLLGWVEKLGWEALLNKRGMIWRKLDDATRANIDMESAIRVMLENPSIIKRPVLDTGKELHVGFKESEYQSIFD